MTAEIRFLGVAGYAIKTRRGQHILIDPFLRKNPCAPLLPDELGAVDLILVSHGAFDHLGDTAEIARATGAPVVCGGDVKAYLTSHGIPGAQVQACIWGVGVKVNGLEIIPVEARHWSQVSLRDGTMVTGVPLGFVIELEPGIRFYHYGDTALFSDLKLIGELYKPTIGCLGITQPAEILHLVEGPGTLMRGEMDPWEATLAAQWLGLDVVLPCHYLNSDQSDVRLFEKYLAEARGRGEKGLRPVVLRPGQTFSFQGALD
jgi:L-ascorbate metabolism protein UlaG (beta-lactamase superfamily)